MKTRNGYSIPVVKAFLKEYGVPQPELEFRFDPMRKWRFDMAWQAGTLEFPVLLFLEVQGSIFSGGRHTRGPALLREYEKINRASVLGWRGLFVTPQQLLTKQTADMIRQCLGLPPVPDRHIGMAKSL